MASLRHLERTSRVLRCPSFRACGVAAHSRRDHHGDRREEKAPRQHVPDAFRQQREDEPDEGHDSEDERSTVGTTHDATSAMGSVRLRRRRAQNDTTPEAVSPNVPSANVAQMILSGRPA